MNNLVNAFKTFSGLTDDDLSMSPSSVTLDRAQIQEIITRLPLILLADMLVGIFLLSALGILLQTWQIAVWFVLLTVSCGIRGLVAYKLIRGPDNLLSPARQRKLRVDWCGCRRIHLGQHLVFPASAYRLCRIWPGGTVAVRSAGRCCRVHLHIHRCVLCLYPVSGFYFHKQAAVGI
jgi:hypothetical protein